MTPPPDNQVAALREEIRRAGGRTWIVRVLLLVNLALGVATSMVVDLRAYSRSEMRAAGPDESRRQDAADRVVMTWALVVPFGIMLMAVTGALGARTGGCAYIWLRRRKFGRRLAALPAGQRAALIRSLRDLSHEDTRKIVAPLLREFNLATELTPAAPPAGRGNEASPAG